MKREEIIEELTKRGYKAKAKDITRGIQIKEGIEIATDNERVNVVAYTSWFDGIEDAGEIADRIESILKREDYKLKKEPDEIRDEVMKSLEDGSNVYIGLEPQNDNEEIVKREGDFGTFEIEKTQMYLYIRIKEEEGDTYCTRITKKMAATTDENLLWERARENTAKEARLFRMGDCLPLTEETKVVMQAEEDIGIQMLVLTNENKTRGAACAVNKNLIADGMKMLNTDTVAILPSSIHELLLVDGNKMAKEELKEIVKEVNRTQVSEEDFLSDYVTIVKKVETNI